MKYFFIVIIAMAVNQISASKPVKCSYELKDIDKLEKAFKQSKKSSNVSLLKILEKQQKFEQDASCGCSEKEVDIKAKDQYIRFGGGNDRSYELIKSMVEYIFFLTKSEKSECSCNARGSIIEAAIECGEGIIDCLNGNFKTIEKYNKHIKLPDCPDQKDRELFIKYAYDRLYLSSGVKYEQCKKDYLEKFLDDLKCIERTLQKCLKESPCCFF